MKYDNLSVFLNTEDKDAITLSFAQIESILGFLLPKSAYTYNAWWANGGHSQAAAWMNVGYHVDAVNLAEKSVIFQKKSGTVKKTAPPSNTLSICGYTFSFVQDLIPECDENGKLIDYYPQDDYPGRDRKRLNQYGAGAFCRFSINADDVPGVYLWVADGEITYIGETSGLARRFNTGYGVIEPVNCYVGGQSTNCKMNKVVLEQARTGKYVKLYFYETVDHKKVELELLGKIKTKYNVKDN